MTSFDWNRLFSSPKYERIRPLSPEGFGTALETLVEMDEATRSLLWEECRDIDIVLFSAETPAADAAAA